MFRTDYDDGEVEKSNLSNEEWKFSTVNSESLSIKKVQLLSGTELSSTGTDQLHQCYEVFRTKEILLHQAQGLSQFLTQNACSTKDINFKKIVKEVNSSKVSSNANIASSHVLYKAEIQDDTSIMIKARIAPHGNKDKEKHTVKSDFAVCPSLQIRTLLSIANIFKRTQARIEVKSTFLRTGEAERDIYVEPPRECKNRSLYWLLLTAAYGLVNAGAKWQDHCDSFFYELGFQQLPYVPQLSYMRNKNGKFRTLAIEVVDDILLCGPLPFVKLLVEKINERYKLGTIVHGFGHFSHYGLIIVQHEDLQIRIHADEKQKHLNHILWTVFVVGKLMKN